MLGTEGTGWDVGQAVRFLASDRARWITGQVLVVDGGTTLRAHSETPTATFPGLIRHHTVIFRHVIGLGARFDPHRRPPGASRWPSHSGSTNSV